jgi:Ca-activated chloride channel homolog
MIELVWPYMLLLAPLPWLVRALLPPSGRRQAALTVPDVGRFRAETEGGARSLRERWGWRLLLLWLIWSCVVVAGARPQRTGDPVTLPTTGRDLMLAVDLSGSMGAEDMQLGNRMVNRLVVVKHVVSDFLARRQGDRVGLILYGTNAYLQAPLTFDLATVERLLNEAPIGIAGGRTGIGDAIGLAVKHLRQRPEGQRVLILLTDGSNNVGEMTPVKAAELASLESIRIHTVGFGADSTRLPSLFGSFSPTVFSPSLEIDEEALKAVANLTGGRFFRASNPAELEEIYGLIDAMEPIEQDPETFRPVTVLYHWPLGLAWVLGFGLLALDRGQRRA